MIPDRCSGWWLLLAWCGVAAAARGQTPPPIPIGNGDWSATDDLGRRLPTAAEVGPPKAGRWVGLFYWQWHKSMRVGPAYDLTAFLSTRPKFMDFQADPVGGPKNADWYWAQPITGYYRSDDPWVIRRHLPLIAAAGVDFLFLDYTNSSVYDRELTTFLGVSDDLKAHGLAVPRLTFFLNYQPEWKIESLYTHWFKPGKHDDSWFRWQGKPLLMSPMPTDATKLKDPSLLPEIQRYFTWRPTWALGKADRDRHLWRFLSTPTDPPSLGPDGRVEQMVVGKSMGGPIWDAVRDGGVSWTGDPAAPPHAAADYDANWMLPDAGRGVFFQAEWDHAMRVAPPILLVTGWNEWTASVWEKPGVVMLGRTTKAGQGHIVDEFNMQFDRDIEPMAPTGPGQPAGYGDNYYLQFAANMRRYKGVAAPATRPAAAVPVPTSPDAAAWAGVRPVFHDTVGDVGHRDWAGSPPGVHYTDATARNDLATAQVTADDTAVTFRVTTAAPLSPPVDGNWMTLLVDADADATTGWHGYDLLVDRTRDDQGAAVERYVGDGRTWRWERVGVAPIRIAGNALTVAVPRRLLRPPPLRFDFKWTDGLPPEPTVWDFYTQGDVAPDGRFNYHFEEALAVGSRVARRPAAGLLQQP